MEIIIYSGRRAAYKKLFDGINSRATGAVRVSFCDDIDELARSLPDVVIADPRMLENSSLLFEIFDGSARGKKTKIIVSAPAHPAGAIKALEKEGFLSKQVYGSSSDKSSCANEENKEEKKEKNKEEDKEDKGYSDCKEEKPRVSHRLDIPKDEDRIIKKRSTFGEPLRVGIAGMGHHAGASFITMVLAEELASEYVDDGSIVIFSTGSAYFYDSLGFESKFSESGFIDAELFASGKAAADSPYVNLSEGISWIVSSPTSVRKPLAQSDRSKTLYRIKGNVILWDIGYELFSSDPEAAVKDIDALIFVIDPLPSSMLTYYDIFKKVKSLNIPVIYVLNRMNSGIDRSEAESFLKIKRPEVIDAVPAESIYASEYACENPYRNKNVRMIISDSINSISERLKKLA